MARQSALGGAGRALLGTGEPVDAAVVGEGGDAVAELVGAKAAGCGLAGVSEASDMP